MRSRQETIAIDVAGKTISGIRQHAARAVDAPRLLCIHGWLDNANSYMPMMPFLRHYDVVAIDLPGHGKSDWLSQDYTLTEMAYRITGVIQALGWEQCHLVGHSLGGAVASTVAVGCPEMVSTLISIEALGSVSESADKLPERTAKAFQERLNLSKFESRQIRSTQDAVESRLAANKMRTASARLLTERQLERVDNGYQWRFDPLWRISRSQYQTEEQVHAMLAAVACPTLVILGEDGYLTARSSSQARLDALNPSQTLTLPGHHHVHMDSPEPVAIAINRFLTDVTATDS